jgi:hypothetical protein
MTAEDLIEEQRETEGRMATEKSQDAVKSFLKNFRNHTPGDDGTDDDDFESSSGAENMGWNIQVVETLNPNP